LLSTKARFQPFNIWLVGDTPIITHAWSEKAKREMLQKQVKGPKPGKEHATRTPTSSVALRHGRRRLRLPGDRR